MYIFHNSETRVIPQRERIERVCTLCGDGKILQLFGIEARDTKHLQYPSATTEGTQVSRLKIASVFHILKSLSEEGFNSSY